MSMEFNKFDKWDEVMDLEGLKNDVQNIKENQKEFREVPYGNYEVKVERLQLTESKKGDPLVSIWFKILTGEYKGSLLFYNQIIIQGFHIFLVNELLRSMGTGLDITFETYSQYGKLLMDIHEMIDEKLEFAIEYGEKRGFPSYKILDVFEVEV